MLLCRWCSQSLGWLLLRLNFGGSLFCSTPFVGAVFFVDLSVSLKSLSRASSDVKRILAKANAFSSVSSRCSVLQCVAVCCSRESRATQSHSRGRIAGTPQHAASRCNMQHTTTYCNTLQHTATYGNTLQHAATCCNMLQRTATCCNTLQHAATHCNTLQHTRTNGKDGTMLTQ